MAITVAWDTRVISVPKSYMTQIQTLPFVVYELNLNNFRLTIADIQDDEEGIVFDTIVNHTQPVDIGGVTLARVVELINGYTVTFEDDQYAVNLIAGNTNLGDNVNVNQVSVRTGNSAGLVDNTPIPTAEENAEAVWTSVTADYEDVDTMGGFLTQAVLTVQKFLGLK